jgi:predicted component of type VI protein secretion system
MLPMTLNRVGKEAASENEDLTRVEDVNDSFAKFKPELKFKGSAGPNETEFKADFKFRSMKDFDPENLQKRQETRDEEGNVTFARNDIADLKSNIDLLYRLKDRWKLPTVRRAWGSETQRSEIITALGRLKEDLQKISGKGGNQ